MSDPGYSILAARYADEDRTALIADTVEAGQVMASQADRPALWARVHRTVTVAPYEPPQLRPRLPRPAPSAPAAPASEPADPRQAALDRVMEAVAEVNRRTDAEHYRYELAILVVNNNIEAMGELKDAAAAAGLPVKEYAQRVISEHNARRRRAARVYAIEERARKDIGAATGDAIEAIAEKAVRDIRGESQ